MSASLCRPRVIVHSAITTEIRYPNCNGEGRVYATATVYGFPVSHSVTWCSGLSPIQNHASAAAGLFTALKWQHGDVKLNAGLLKPGSYVFVRI